MPSEPIVVEPARLDALREPVRSQAKASGLVESFREAAPGAWGFSRASLDLLDSLEAGLCAGLAARDALLSRIAADRAAGFAGGEPTARERQFASAFAVLVACREALAAAERLGEVALPERGFPPGEVAPILSASDPAPALLADLKGYLDHYRRHPDAARRVVDEARLDACVRSHLHKLALAALAACDTPEHAPIRKALAAATLRLPSSVWAGLTRRPVGGAEEPDLLDVGPEDVVGNAEVLQAGLKLARHVAAFDLAAGKSPRAGDNPVLFVLGSPGCGKTVTAHAVGRYFLKLCKDAGMPANFRVVRRTDWASHFQNKSASDLLRIFRDEVFDFPGVAGCYWPDIDTAFAARSDPDIRAEEKANLATLFGLLDGTVGPRNGKWFLLCDANTMAMDEAMTSRLAQDPKVAKGPETPADYVRLLRDVKLASLRGLLPPDPDWEAVGARLVEAKLSGRAVAAIAGKLSAEIQDVEEPEGFFTMSYEHKVEALQRAARPVTRERILEHIDHYVRFEKEAADRAWRERFDRRVEEIRLQLSAQATALGR